MILNFTKMHGLGNDFIVIDNRQNDISLNPDRVRFLADRHTGIGCDQILVILKGTNDAVDIRFRFYNSDGSEAGQCGNGVRCLGKYLVDTGVVAKTDIRAETVNGVISVHVQEDGNIRVNMGAPRFEPAEIPLAYGKRQPEYEIELTDGIVRVFSLSMGNPHAVLMVDDIDTAPVEELGRKIQASPRFPDSVNVGFLQILDRKHVKLRVYERGAGETLACGTGTCAAVVAGIMNDKLDNEVTVTLKRGDLVISWEGEGREVWMTGPATNVYKGQIEI